MAAGLLAGLWAGLVRLGWGLPAGGGLAAAHGPLMVGTVLSSVISLERAVALGRPWAYSAPALAGAGGLALVAGLSLPVAAGLLAGSSLALVAVFARLYRLRPEWASALMSLGAATWLVGNGLWLGGRAIVEVVPWWAAFLVLTIAGERLELAQVLVSTRVRGGLSAAAILILTGLLLSLPRFLLGVHLVGLGFLALAAWLARYDVARRALHRGGLARFGGVCLLLGYVWLGVAGLLWLLGPEIIEGLWYDAMVHSLFVGFVFSMIFGHAPTIVPAVTGIGVPFERAFYLHVGLLHGSLLARIGGDLTSSSAARDWGGLLNAAALLLFAILTARAIRRARRAAAVSAPRPPNRARVSGSP